ncbi:hypothetical protein KP509_30G066100 [Ceratopteris richardii]|uniref:Homeobox domain-containing protein n=1 Tax=Ceratopteris richardii TaxID=49495 RepID=A0A8T2R5F5_CERRI|nr:hypothetical protein KP509_30G066100 [Ceratopteris richardii]
MEPCEMKSGPNDLPTVNDSISSTSPKPMLRLTAEQRQQLELLYRQCPRPNSAVLEQAVKDNSIISSLDVHLLKAWFRTRRLKEKLSPLINKNAELKAEHENLLFLNNRLRSEALLLNLENKRLKEQLEVQLCMRQLLSSSKAALSETGKQHSDRLDDGANAVSSEPGTCDLESSFCEVKL